MKQISANKLRIISEDYKEEVYSTSIKTICKITYINPLTGGKQVSKGVAKCSKKEYNLVKEYNPAYEEYLKRMESGEEEIINMPSPYIIDGTSIKNTYNEVVCDFIKT